MMSNKTVAFVTQIDEVYSSNLDYEFTTKPQTTVHHQSTIMSNKIVAFVTQIGEVYSSSLDYDFTTRPQTTVNQPIRHHI